MANSTPFLHTVYTIMYIPSLFRYPKNGRKCNPNCIAMRRMYFTTEHNFISTFWKFSERRDKKIRQEEKGCLSFHPSLLGMNEPRRHFWEKQRFFFSPSSFVVSSLLLRLQFSWDNFVLSLSSLLKISELNSKSVFYGFIELMKRKTLENIWTPILAPCASITVLEGKTFLHNLGYTHFEKSTLQFSLQGHLFCNFSLAVFPREFSFVLPAAPGFAILIDLMWDLVLWFQVGCLLLLYVKGFSSFRYRSCKNAFHAFAILPAYRIWRDKCHMFQRLTGFGCA